MGTVFTLVLLACVALNVVWSVSVRKLAKTRIASILSIVSVVVALIGTVTVKNSLTDPAFFEGTLLPLAEPSIPAEIMEMFNFSATLRQTIIGLPVALVTPLIFVALFLVVKLLTGIIYLLIVLIAGRKLKKSSKKVSYVKERTLAWSVAASLLTLTVVLLPVAFYGGMAADILEFASSADMLDKDLKKELKTVSTEYVTPITDSALVQSFRVLGGDAMLADLTTFELNGAKISVNEEIENVLDVANGVAPLLGADFQNLSEKEADNIVDAANALSKSKFLTSIAAEAVYYFTDDIVSGDKPLTLDESGMFDTVVDRVVTTLHDDAKAAVRPAEGAGSAEISQSTKRFNSDIKTVAELASALLRGGILSSTGDTEALLDELANGSTIKDMIIALGKNDGLKCLIPEVTNIGIRAIASFMEVKADATVVYDELMNTIAADLNSVKALDDAAKVKELSPKLNSAFDHAGIVIDKQVLDLYSVAIIEGILNQTTEEVRAIDVQYFFVDYANGAQLYVPNVDVAVDTVPAKLAHTILSLSALDAKGESFNDDVAAILAQYAQSVLGTNEGALYEAVVSVNIKKAIDSAATEQTPYNTSVNTASLQSAEEMKKTTFLKTLDILLIDIDEASQKINDQTLNREADTIASIFACAGDLMDDVSGDINISTMATSVGDILNAFRDSVCVGEERTSNLFIAIIQSSFVRDAASMDIFTATDLGVRGSTGQNVDYAKTFKTISNTMDVLANMSSTTEGGMTTEDLSTVLKDLNPQTAGMIESYITEDRLAEDYGLDAEQSATAAPLISDVFGYMGDADMTEEECAKEAEALTDVMNLVTSASDKANSGESSQTVFGGEDSVLGKSADDTVATFMASEALKHSLNKNSADGTLDEDPFGMGDMMVENEETSEVQDLKDAMKNYYETTEYETEEEKAADKEALTNLGKLFGFSTEDMDELLGQ